MSRLANITTAGVVLAILGCNPGRETPHPLPLPQPPGLPAVPGGGARSPRVANYVIDAQLNAARHQIAATETVIWTNPGTTTVDRLPFHLYLNAFKNERTLFWRTSHGQMRGVRASDSSWGWIDINSVTVDGAEQVAKLHGPDGLADDETVIELPLDQPLGPGQTIAVRFRFTAQLPEAFARTGYKGEFHMVAQWFPKIGVRTGPEGAEHWDCPAHQANAEFFADFGTYDVTLTVPNTFAVAATGILTAATDAPGGTRVLVYRAEDVHDFTWMADPYMRELKGIATLEDGVVQVSVWHRPEQAAFARRHLQAGIGAIETFSRHYVPYPWSQLTIVDPPVDAAMAVGGMEYQTLVTTAGDTVFARPGIYFPEYITVHEIGHNWFQGMLASNEPREPWLDEGINEWADARVLNELYGARTSAVNAFGFQAEHAALRIAIANDLHALPTPIAAPASDFADPNAYAEAVYDGTLRALTTLERQVGATKFAAAMQAYAKAFAFRHPTERDFVTALETHLGERLDWFFTPLFHGIGGSQPKLRSASCKPAHPPRGVVGERDNKKLISQVEAPQTGTWVCEVVVQDTGPVHIPIDIELQFRDGTTQRMLWDDQTASGWQRFVVERSSDLIAVRLDPDDKLAIASPIAKHYRIEGDGAAAMRAAARAASWTQTLLQLIGP